MVLYTFYEELKMLSEEQLLRKQYRHAIKFIVRCDLTLDTDRTGPGWPATISSPPDTFFPGLLLLKPHSARGKELCAALERGDTVHFRLGWVVYTARVASKGNVTGAIWLRAHDVSSALIRPVCLFDETHPEPPNGRALRSGKSRR
jgi:hypothetical protein